MPEDNRGRGIAYLVGAGPGGIDQVTLLGLKRLRRAECVLYDDFASPSILGEAPAAAELICVGKSPNEEIMSQEAINALLCDKVEAGKAVVRLHVGDPMVFGKGGEEAAALSRRGLRFEVVPGVTTALAVAAYAGVPITMAAAASGVSLIDGRRFDSRILPSPDWVSLARSGQTLCVYGDAAKFGGIARELLRGGRDAEEPAAIVSSVSLPEQNVIVTELKDVGNLSVDTIPRPAMMVVGKAVAWRKTCSWFEKRPLFGRRILIARTRLYEGCLAGAFGELGAIVVEMPIIAIEATEFRADGARDELSAVLLGLADVIVGDMPTWIVFADSHAVREVWRRMEQLRLDGRIFGGAGIVAIGDAAERELAARGMVADVVPREDLEEGLVNDLRDRLGGALGEYRFVIFAGPDEADRLAESLTSLGADCRVVLCYHKRSLVETDSEARNAFDAGTIAAVPFASAEAVRNFARLFFDRLGFWLSQPARPRFTAMDRDVADEMRAAGIPVDAVAAEANLDGIVRATLSALDADR